MCKFKYIDGVLKCVACGVRARYPETMREEYKRNGR